MRRRIRIDPVTGAWEAVATPGGLLGFALDVDVDERRQLFIVDRTCCGSTGGILQVDPETGAQAVLAAFDGLVPLRLVLVKKGELFIGGRDEAAGAFQFQIVSLDLATGVVSPPPVDSRAQAVKEALLEAFERKGGAAYLARVADEDPRTFCMMLARLLPAELRASLEGSSPP